VLILRAQCEIAAEITGSACYISEMSSRMILDARYPSHSQLHAKSSNWGLMIEPFPYNADKNAESPEEAWNEKRPADAAGGAWMLESETHYAAALPVTGAVADLDVSVVAGRRA